MTTAHRPTWKAAVGRASEGGWTAGGALSAASSALDAPSHTKIKFRQGPQVVDKETQKRLLKESLLKLEQVEEQTLKQKTNSKSYIIKNVIGKRRLLEEDVEKQSRLKLIKHQQEKDNDIDDQKLREKYDDQDASDDGRKDNDDDDSGGESDSSSDLDASSSDDEDDDSSDDDEDEEAALQAELEKIRKEREAAKMKAELEEAAKEEAKMSEAAMLGNPLLNGGDSSTAASSGRMKRRWNDDVVFRNQARDEPKLQKRFINDTVRNDFHKRFLTKFIR